MPMTTRRSLLMAGAAAVPAALGAGLLARQRQSAAEAAPDAGSRPEPLKITGLRFTPVALPDPPLLAASGCHGPYFLRTIVEVETDAGITGIGETRGDMRRLAALEKSRKHVLGKNAFAWRSFAADVTKLDAAAYAGIELACLDACGKATGRRLCELLGGPVREDVEFAAYLFFRYASDHPQLIHDERIVDDRGTGKRALDDWGEVRTAEAMADMAERFRRKFGFRVFKLKAGVLPPELEVDALHAMNERFGGKLPLRIDPNARWTMETALKMAQRFEGVPLEYYEDPVRGQEAMAEVRRRTGLTMSTNMCVTRFAHVPSALKLEPIDVVLGDHHGWGGMAAFQELGRLCETVGWQMSQHSNNHAGITMAAMIHAAAATPQLSLASDTHYVWLPDGADLIAGGKLPIRDGKMNVPEGPGLGVELDRDRLAWAHEVYRKSGMTRRDDAATMRRIQPDWQRTLY